MPSFWSLVLNVLRSYRFRLFLAFLGVLVASLGLYLGTVLGQFTHYTLQAQGDLLLSRLELWTYTLDLVNHPLSPETQKALHQGSEELHAAVILILDGGKARFLALNGYAPPEEELQRIWFALERRLSSPTPVTFQNGSIIVVAVPVLENQSKTLIAAAAPARIGWRHLVDSVVNVTLVGLIGAALLAWLLARSVSRPVIRLIQSAHRVAQGIYDDPPLPSSNGELGQLAQTFNTMREQVRQAQQIQRDFLTGVSHDLKTPLSIIKGYVSALEDGVADDEAKRSRALVGIQRETDRMSDLIASLLELARLESGLLPFNPRLVDVVALARNVLTAFAAQAQEKNVCFVDHLPSNAPHVPADERQIRRVITNLVDNALQFTEPGGVVLLGGESQSGRVCLWIEDSGPGIPSEALGRIFEKFFRADSARGGSRKGSGLGLAIAREIMLHHKGYINAENLPTQGARFTICLPLT